MSRNRGAGLKVLERRCMGLRWKGMFIDADDDPTVQLSNSRIYWCVFSQNPVGPDGGSVDEDCCTASRKCYKRV
ncbi:MAG: hypothetical protein GC160_23660 [Acidobacteria bacterium]|nr:hypothetical protein [Acidobacteriota bacterium]